MSHSGSILDLLSYFLTYSIICLLTHLLACWLVYLLAIYAISCRPSPNPKPLTTPPKKAPPKKPPPSWRSACCTPLWACSTRRPRASARWPSAFPRSAPPGPGVCPSPELPKALNRGIWEFQKIRGPVLGSLHQESWYVGSILGVCDSWKLPCTSNRSRDPGV